MFFESALQRRASPGCPVAIAVAKRKAPRMGSTGLYLGVKRGWETGAHLSARSREEARPLRAYVKLIQKGADRFA